MVVTGSLKEHHDWRIGARRVRRPQGRTIHSGQLPEEKAMKRSGIIATLAILLVALTATTASAAVNFDNAPQGAHFAKGYGEPQCSLDGTTVTCTGTQIVGVGNTNATVTLDVTSTIAGVCHNPGVNSKVVDPFSESVTESTSSLITSTKNGRLIVPAQSTTGVDSGDFLETFTCPNPNWTPEVTSNVLSFSYTLTFAGFSEPAIWITG
jgi:hypothetical protein